MFHEINPDGTVLKATQQQNYGFMKRGCGQETILGWLRRNKQNIATGVLQKTKMALDPGHIDQQKFGVEDEQENGN